MGDRKWVWLGEPARPATEDARPGFYHAISPLWDGLTSRTPVALKIVAAANYCGYGPSSACGAV